MSMVSENSVLMPGYVKVVVVVFPEFYLVVKCLRKLVLI
jgi:hypothetical protein